MGRYPPNPRRKNGWARDRLRARLLQRTDICALCGQPMPTPEQLADMSHLDPRYPVLDEIVPISKGGTLTPDNTQLVHRRCNAMKSDKILTAPLMRPRDPPKAAHSRKW
jgi:5-methylcytosine-specific restriction endonuclease McrA